MMCRKEMFSRTNTSYRKPNKNTACKMEVIWSAKSRITFFIVLDYLEKNWSKTELLQFIRKTELVIQAIQKNPGIFACSSKHKSIRRAIIDKNNALYYQVDKKNRKIYLLTFFDNRQNPENLKFSPILKS